MRYIIAWTAIIFVVILLVGRTDLLHDIGAGVRSGVDAIKDGYNSRDSIEQ